MAEAVLVTLLVTRWAERCLTHQMACRRRLPGQLRAASYATRMLGHTAPASDLRGPAVMRWDTRTRGGGSTANTCVLVRHCNGSTMPQNSSARASARSYLIVYMVAGEMWSVTRRGNVADHPKAIPGQGKSEMLPAEASNDQTAWPFLNHTR